MLPAGKKAMSFKYERNTFQPSILGLICSLFTLQISQCMDFPIFLLINLYSPLPLPQLFIHTNWFLYTHTPSLSLLCFLRVPIQIFLSWSLSTSSSSLFPFAPGHLAIYFFLTFLLASLSKLYLALSLLILYLISILLTCNTLFLPPFGRRQQTSTGGLYLKKLWVDLLSVM